MQILAREPFDFRAMRLQPRKQLLNTKFAEGVSAFQDESLQGHEIALRAIWKCVSNTADWGTERATILTAVQAQFCKLVFRMG
jgi:hypothetical protein